MDFSLFYSDGLHLVEKGNLKLGKSILKAIDSNSNANPYKNAVCFSLNECDFPSLPSPSTTSKPLYSPVKCVGPVREPIRHLFRSFAQASKPFRSVVLPVCSVPISMSHSSLCQLVVASAPCVSPVRITTATFPSHVPNICYADASIRSFSSKFNLSLLLSLLFLHVKSVHLLPLVSLLTHQVLHVLVPPLLQHFLLHRIRTVTELLRFLVPISLPILRLVLLIL